MAEPITDPEALRADGNRELLAEQIELVLDDDAFWNDGQDVAGSVSRIMALIRGEAVTLRHRVDGELVVLQPEQSTEALIDAVRKIAAEEDRDEWDAADRLGRIRDVLGGDLPTLDTPERFLEYARAERERAVEALRAADLLITTAKGEIHRRAGRS